MQLIDLEALLIPLGFFSTVVLIVWIGHLGRRRDRDRRAELIRQLIDKFSTGEAFAKAMESPEGWRLAAALSLESSPAKKTSPLQGLLTTGIILTFLGLAFFVLAAIENPNFWIPGVLTTALGAAFLVSAAAAWRMTRDDPNDQPAPTHGAGDGPTDDPSGRLP